MDNEPLNKVLLDVNDRKFWIVLWGYPERSPDEDKQIFDEPVYDEGLSKNVTSMRIGDILFVHRIKVAKLIYVSEVIDPPRKSTAQESQKEEWRKRWKWSVRGENLTPKYGQHWRRCGEKTFTLAKRFNELNPTDPVNIGRINFGSHVEISQHFALFLLQGIKALRDG